MPGDRSGYFEIQPDAFAASHGHLDTLRLMGELLDKGLTAIKDPEGARGRRLHETREFYRFLEREYPVMVERFQKEYRNQRG